MSSRTSEERVCQLCGVPAWVAIKGDWRCENHPHEPPASDERYAPTDEQRKALDGKVEQQLESISAMVDAIADPHEQECESAAMALLQERTSNPRDAARWQHCERFGFPVRNQTGGGFRSWVAFEADGNIVYGDSPATAVDAAMRASDVAAPVASNPPCLHEFQINSTGHQACRWCSLVLRNVPAQPHYGTSSPNSMRAERLGSTPVAPGTAPPSNELCSRLRAAGRDERLSTGSLYLEAAAEIERLRTEIDYWTKAATVWERQAQLALKATADVATVNRDPYGLDCPHGKEPDSCMHCADMDR